MKLLVSLKMVQIRLSLVIKQHRKYRKHGPLLICDHTSQTIVLQTVFVVVSQSHQASTTCANIKQLLWQHADTVFIVLHANKQVDKQRKENGLYLN